MRCDKHGELSADWVSCPYCIREGVRNQAGGAPPPPPSLQNWGAANGAGAPPANVTRGNVDAGGGGGNYGGGRNNDVTRGAGGPPMGSPANVTRGAGADVGGFGWGARGGAPANVTRIVDPPPLARRKVRAWLIQKDGPRPDTVHPIKDDVTWIGRDPRADIFIDDDSVSGQHAKLWVDDDKALRILNVSTSNGTQVNGVRMEAPVELRENDEVRLGTVVLVLKRLDEPPARTQAAAAPAAVPAAPPVASPFAPPPVPVAEPVQAVVPPPPPAVVPPPPSHVPAAPPPSFWAAPRPITPPPVQDSNGTRCEKHGPLLPDWTSCPFCIREALQGETAPAAAPAPAPHRSAPAPSSVPATVPAPPLSTTTTLPDEPLAESVRLVEPTLRMERPSQADTLVMTEPEPAAEPVDDALPSNVTETIPGTLPNPFRSPGGA